MAFQRVEESEERIAELEAGIQRLKENGRPTLEAVRLLRLMRRSPIATRRQVDLQAKDQT